MRALEANRLKEIIAEQDAGAVTPLLNLGSSTRYFREISQPHIQHKLFGPLEAAGIRVVHSDLKAGDGVDVIGDILSSEVRASLKEMGFRSVLLSNLLEHVTDRPAVAAACEDIVGSGGLIVATVPKSYPYHPDPIDTYYRPSPQALARLFRRSRLLHGEELTDRTFREDLKERGLSPAPELGKLFKRSFTFFRRTRGWLSLVHRWFWFARRYRTTIVVLQVD